MMHLKHLVATAAMALALLAASGCDPQRISELEPGAPPKWTCATVLACLTISGMQAVACAALNTTASLPGAQLHDRHRRRRSTGGRAPVLTPENFTRIQPAWTWPAVRRLLGKAY